MNWHKHFDKRQLNEIEFSLLYARDFQHGTDGHNAKLVIAQMSTILSHIENILLVFDNPNNHKLRQIEEVLRISGEDEYPSPS